jgi:penicillin G amidase
MLRVFFIVVLILAFALPVTGWWLAQRTLPAMNGVVTLSDLRSPVIVKFDTRAIPYIDASTETDAWMAQGYLMARDRMFQMDMLRRAARGELSEIYGLGTLPADKLMRTIGIRRSAEAEARALPAVVRANLEAFSRGVNLYIVQNSGNFPVEFTLLAYRPRFWEPSDSIAILKYMSYTFDESWKLDDLRQRIYNKIGKAMSAELFQENWSQTPTVVPAPAAAPAATPSKGTAPKSISKLLDELSHCFDICYFLGVPRPGWGSNTWAISPKFSQTGGSMLACDKHSEFSAPDLWYLSSVASPGFHVAGATISGVPGILFGRNDYIAWGGSSLKGDVQDLFVEQFSPLQPVTYRTDKGWEQPSEITEEIGVRFGKNYLHKVLLTKHGPVLLRDGENGVSFSWSENAPGQSALETIYRLNHAASWTQFSSALQTYPGPTQSFVYADRLGGIGYQAAGRLPIRSMQGDGTGLTSGWSPSGQWTAYVSPSTLPSSANPASGYVVACNQKLLPANHPLMIGHQFAAPYRAFRVADVINTFNTAKRKFSLSDMGQLQADQYAYLSPLVKEEIRQSIVRTELIDSYQLSALDAMTHWDGQLSPDSTAATIYEAFLETLARRVIQPKIGPEMTNEYLQRWPMWPLFIEYYLREKPPVWMPAEERAYSTFVLTTFSQSLKTLKVTQSNTAQDWPWRAAHQATFEHLITKGVPWLGYFFNVGPIGLGGDPNTVNATAVEASAGKTQFHSASGPTMRMLIDMTDNDKFYQSITLGQSGQLSSSYYKDQLPAWVKADPLPVAFSPSQIDKQMQSKLILSNQ